MDTNFLRKRTEVWEDFGRVDLGEGSYFLQARPVQGLPEQACGRVV